MKRIIWLVILTFTLFSCGSSELSREEVLSNSDSISKLHSRVEKAREQNTSLKAPRTFRKAQEKLEQAIAQAQKSSGDSQVGRKSAKEGLELLKQAKKHAQKSQEVLGKSYALRMKAKKANAGQYFPEHMKEVEEELIEAAEHVEQGEIQEARDKQNEILMAYEKLESESLTRRITSGAQKSFDEAKRAEAQDYAPKSFALAKDALRYAREILKNDPTKVQKAQEEAKEAKYLSERAKQIAILAKSFERRDFTSEDMVLWYHGNLNRIAGALDKEISYSRENNEIVSALREEVKRLKESYAESVAMLERRERNIDSLRMRFSSVSKDTKRGAYRIPQSVRPYDAVEDLFEGKEAQVYRKKNEVIIRAHGLDFPVGESRIDSQNYELVSKLLDAAYLFPDAKKIVFAGHSDSGGSSSLNKKISKQRAENLKKLFASIGKIPAEKLEALGFGESEPVASNQTSKGRMLNRRIEMRIINE